jgi:hypothetical protein
MEKSVAIKLTTKTHLFGRLLDQVALSRMMNALYSERMSVFAVELLEDYQH